MATNALPPPRQLYLLPQPVAASEADVLRLLWFVRRLQFGDAAVSGSFRLERQCFQRVCDCEQDDAPDGALVTGTYVEYIVFAAGRLCGAVEVRSEDGVKVDGLHAKLARYLLAAGWQVAATRLVIGGAICSPEMNLNRVKRILKSEKEG